MIKDLQLTPTGSSSDPVTVADLKAYLQLEGTAFDSVLTTFISSSRMMIESRVGVSLVEQDAVAWMQLDSRPEQIPMYPITAVTTVEYSSDGGKVWETQTEFDDYIIEGGDRQTITAGTGYYRITYELGAGNYADLIQAVTIQAGYMWTHRDAANVKGIAPIVEQIIQPYILSY